MPAIADVLPSGVAEQLETPRWIIFCVCVVGVFLAYFTDEGYSFLLGSEDATTSTTGSRHRDAAGQKPSGGTGSGAAGATASARDRDAPANIVTHRNSSSASHNVRQTDLAISSTAKKADVETQKLFGSIVLYNIAMWLVTTVQDSLPSVVLTQLACLEAGFRKQRARFSLYLSASSLKKRAHTKRHFFYLMEKKILDLPIRDNETEVDSYLDCKNHLGTTWPFMWEVANVKETAISCGGIECVPMSSYSYLDLLRDARVQKAAIAAAEKWSSGNHGPRMLGGNMTILRDLEKVIAKFFNRDDSLLCATGYLACMSACAAVCSENTVVFGDSRLHASLKAGLKIGEGKTVSFKHNDFKDCEKLIRQFRHKYTNAWMVIESVYSMDGDIGDLPAAHALCEKYNIKLMIDEAHGLGVVGKTGRGVEELYGLQGCADLIVGTFSKSIASIGGYITGNKNFISYLDFHALGNVFSAPLPAYSAGAALKSFEVIDAEPHIIKRAQENSRKLRAALATGLNSWPEDYPEENKYELEGDEASTVLPIVFPDDIDRVMRVATTLKHKGFMCSAVAYPACPLRRPRFRITATAAYDDALIERFAKTLVAVCVAEPPSRFKQDVI